MKKILTHPLFLVVPATLLFVVCCNFLFKSCTENTSFKISVGADSVRNTGASSSVIIRGRGDGNVISVKQEGGGSSVVIINGDTVQNTQRTER